MHAVLQQGGEAAREAEPLEAGQNNNKENKPSVASSTKKRSCADASTLLQALGNHFTCPICQDWLLAAHVLPNCGHMFCGLCSASWLARKHSCPTCRKPVTGATQAPQGCLLVLPQTCVRKQQPA